MNPALAFLAGDRSSETLDALEAGLRAWLDGEPAPTRCEVRRALRDNLLRQAAELIEAPSRWARAEALAARCRAFELRRWPCWRDMAEAPLRADGVDRLLFEARRYGDVQLTARTLYEL